MNSTSCKSKFNILWGVANSIPFSTHELKASQFFHLEFCLTLNGGFLELAALHAKNSGALYEQLFWGLSGLRDWIDIFVHRELLECKLGLWTSLSPFTWRIWSDDMHFYLPVSHKSGWKKPLVFTFTFRIVPAWQYAPFEYFFLLWITLNPSQV